MNFRASDQEIVHLKFLLAALLLFGGGLLVLLGSALNVVEQLLQIVSGQVAFERDFRRKHLDGMDDDFVRHDGLGLHVQGDGADFDGFRRFVAFGVADDEIFQFTAARKDRKFGAAEFDIRFGDFWSGLLHSGFDEAAQEVKRSGEDEDLKDYKNCDDLE